MTDIMYGTCDSHVGVHKFRNDPDPCIGWMDQGDFRTAVDLEEGRSLQVVVTSEGVIFDVVSDGEVVATEGMTFDEIAYRVQSQ